MSSSSRASTSIKAPFFSGFLLITFTDSAGFVGDNASVNISVTEILDK